MPDDRFTYLRNRVSWGAILAGVAAAVVVQLLLNILGVGIGASAVDAANTADNPSASGFSLTAGIWWTLSGIIASFVGGVVAGRLCGTSDDNTAHWHGFVSWCAATLVIFYLLTSAVGGIIGGAFNALGSTVGAAGKGAASAVTGIAQNTNGDALQSQMQRLVNPNSAQSAQDDIMTYVRASVSGDQAGAAAARDRAVNGLAKTSNIQPRGGPHPAAAGRAAAPPNGGPGEAEGATGGRGDSQGRRQRRHLRLRGTGLGRRGVLVRWQRRRPPS